MSLIELFLVEMTRSFNFYSKNNYLQGIATVQGRIIMLIIIIINLQKRKKKRTYRQHVNTINSLLTDFIAWAYMVSSKLFLPCVDLSHILPAASETFQMKSLDEAPPQNIIDHDVWSKEQRKEMLYKLAKMVVGKFVSFKFHLFDR